MIEQLKRLSELAPDVCKIDSLGDYLIDGAVFYQDDKGVFSVDITRGGRVFLKGNDALDLLVGRLKRAIEARGWMWTTWEDLGKGAKVFTDKTGYSVDDYDTEVAALLAALIEALEGER